MKTTRRAWHSAALLAVAASIAASRVYATGTVYSVRFATSVCPSVFHVPEQYQRYESFLRPVLATLPEKTFIATAFSFLSGQSGTVDEQQTNLLRSLNRTYASIQRDDAFAGIESVLPYCFATTPNTNGHYFMYRPARLANPPRVIVFLHGFGGNLLFYPWVLKEEFPDALILIPSWGVSWFSGSMAYLQDMLRDAERRTGVAIKKPLLIGISAGGRGGFRIYHQNPTAFSGYVCLASAPDTVVATNLNRSLRVLMINGTYDDMAPIQVIRSQVAVARRRLPSLRFEELPSDHFFFMTRRQETFGLVRTFMGWK